MPVRFFIAVAALVFAGSGLAQAADCSLKLLNEVQMKPVDDGLQELVPVKINGTDVDFVFDTGGFTTQIGNETVKSLGLPVRQGDFELYDATGRISRNQAGIRQFVVGRLHGEDTSFPVSPLIGNGGILAINYMRAYDIDVDFPTDDLKFFSQDHCPGHVLYWGAAVVGIVPITVRDSHITVPVTLDGHDITAIINTGAPHTSLRMDVAKHLYSLTMGTADTPEDGVLNGDAGLTAYTHRFQNPGIGDITVRNAQIRIIPDVVNRNGDHSQQTGNRALLANHDITLPELIIGMNVLHKLHVYMAFGENRLYVSPPAATPAAAPALAPSAPKP